MSGCASLEIKKEEKEVSEIKLSIIISPEKYFKIKELLDEKTDKAAQELTESIIKVIAQKENNETVYALEAAATKFLREFGIPAHTKGYRYLREAIVLVAENPELMEGVTKKLYPKIAELYDSTAERVERAVRHAIESGCTKGDTEALNYYFSHRITKDKLKPTNAEFIATISDAVKKTAAEKQMVFSGI